VSDALAASGCKSTLVVGSSEGLGAPLRELRRRSAPLLRKPAPGAEPARVVAPPRASAASRRWDAGGLVPSLSAASVADFEGSSFLVGHFGGPSSKGRSNPTAASVAVGESFVPPPSVRLDVQTPRRDAARCLNFRATVSATTRSRLRQRALQGTRSFPSTPFARRGRAPLERPGFSSEIPSQARSPRHYAVASRPSGRWRSATFGRRLRRENRRCRCVGCQRRHVRVVWSRDLDVCSVDALPLARELRRIATVPFGRIVTVPRWLPLRGNRALHGCFCLRPSGCSGDGLLLACRTEKCSAARPVAPRWVNDLLLGIRPAGWIARSATASAACHWNGVFGCRRDFLSTRV